MRTRLVHTPAGSYLRSVSRVERLFYVLIPFNLLWSTAVLAWDAVHGFWSLAAFQAFFAGLWVGIGFALWYVRRVS